MTTQIIITLAVLCVVMGMFAWNRVPAAAVAMGASLGLYFAGILTAPEFIHGVGDSVVILIAALLVIATGLEMAGVSVGGATPNQPHRGQQHRTGRPDHARGRRVHVVDRHERRRCVDVAGGRG